MAKTERITNCGLTAEIDTLGGQLISLVKNDVEYIWQRDAKYWSGCAPILFPVVGRLRDGILTIKGKDYPMPKHGFARDLVMNVADKTDSSVKFELKSSEETKKFYPWDFEFCVKFALNNSCLTVSFEVKNTDKEAMIFGLGGHPAFNVPMYDGDKFTDYRLEFEKEELLESNYVNPDDSISADKKEVVLNGGKTINIKRSLFNNDAMIFENIKSKSVKLINHENKGIKFSYDGFPTFAVWTKGEPEEAEFVCLEPWISMGFRDNEDSKIESKCGMKTLMPGEKFSAAFEIEICD